MDNQWNSPVGTSIPEHAQGVGASTEISWHAGRKSWIWSGGNYEHSEVLARGTGIGTGRRWELAKNRGCSGLQAVEGISPPTEHGPRRWLR